MDFAALIAEIDSFVWGPVIITLLVGSHVFLTFRTGFIQRKLPTAIKLSVTKDKDAVGDVSQFGALTTALSATIGTGNIVGVATAILAGGPGAVLWMWLIGIFGIATKYAETYVAVKYRVKDHKGNMLGGAMYAWRRHFQRHDGTVPWWAKLGAALFALFAAIASFGIGAAVQSNAVSSVISGNFPLVPDWLIGLVIVAIIGLVVLGGIKVIARVCEVLVPFMAAFYVLGCIIILCINATWVLPALQLIITSAFTPQATVGGVLGSGVVAALRFGAARGLFSNESGLGSAPIVASAATTRNPARQALVSMTGTFWDTVIICLLTGLVLTSTMLANPELLGSVASGTITAGAELTNSAFNLIPIVGKWVLVIGMATFAVSTALGWAYYGNRCVAYLFGRHALLPYHLLYVFVCFLGAIGIGGVVWDISDITNALMAVPNIIVVLLLSNMIAKETKHYVYKNNLDDVDKTETPVIERH
ncbi:MAG: amino acid carrier protein [Coriobacteriales bacterium]|jgi:AGCS family alanine or glycine:cation symporter|nr:amino acid carrier protein [Coriobacteriales bacterium]